MWVHAAKCGLTCTPRLCVRSARSRACGMRHAAAVLSRRATGATVRLAGCRGMWGCRAITVLLLWRPTLPDERLTEAEQHQYRVG